MLNENTLSMIATFAKSKKINKLELQKLVEDVLGVAVPKVGRKASEATLVLRKELANTPSIVEEYKVKQYTAKELAAIFKQEQVTVNNTLNYLEKQGTWKRAGTAPKEKGKRGRAEVVWEIVQ